jgi:predicted GNAT family N-acyltransferase
MKESTVNGIVVRGVNWDGGMDNASLRDIRRRVFIEEQRVPESLEWDEFDAVSLHSLAETEAGIAIATGRLLPDGHIGRMAVLPEWRRRGVGYAVLLALMAAARARGDQSVRLHAQVHALGFYRKAGFVADGPVFDDAGIPHRTMSCRL